MTNDEEKQITLIAIREANARLNILVEELGYNASIGGYRKIATLLCGRIDDVLLQFRGQIEYLKEILHLEEEKQKKYE